MPKFLEKKLKERYGKDSAIPYKIMNAKGYMKGPHETAEGRRVEKKHMRKVGANRGIKEQKGGKKGNPNRYQPTGLIRGLGGERHRAAEKSKKRHHKGPTFTEAMNRS